MSPPKLYNCNWLNTKGYQYQYLRDFPQLVLYTLGDTQYSSDEVQPRFPKPSIPPQFKRPEQWVNLFHQTAGYACNHLFLHAQFLKPRREVEALMHELAQDYFESCLGGHLTLRVVNGYEARLQRQGVTADQTYPLLAEGFYPIDVSSIRLVTNEEFPENLQELLVKDPTSSKFSFPYVQFNLAILTENCD